MPRDLDETTNCAVIFCARCGSRLVDVRGWREEGLAIFRCSNCDNETEVRGFTIGRTEVSIAEFTEAAEDRAYYEPRRATRH